MVKRVLIIGSGTGGTIVANGLARRLGASLRNGEVAITMLGATPHHFYQPGLLYLPFGRMSESELFRDQTKVLNRYIAFYVDPAAHIDVDTNRVIARSGKVYDYDYLVIATGSRLMIDAIPGMATGSHWFYDLEGARRLKTALDDFRGGKIVINVNVPHKCPVAPLEMTLMLHDFLRTRGLLAATTFTYTYPIGRVHAMVPVAEWTRAEFDRLGIGYETFFNTSAIDPHRREITSEEGVTLPYDLLITIPPHQGASVITDSKLGAGGFVPTNRATLQREGSNNVFVVGDTTDIPISKAGSTAHFEAEVVVENLASVLAGGSQTRLYDGKVYCFIQTGMDSGTTVWFNYETPPRLKPPSQMIHWSKLAYNRLYWLSVRGLL